MTSSSDKNDSDKTERPEESEPTNVSSGAAPESTSPADSDGATSNEESPDQGDATSEEELPEWEPLTPELVEDEAVRGDFMLRWAVILLAFLLGCTQVGESETLVHIKTGQYLMANGWLPPSTDVFSSTAGDRPWTNLSWLYDLIVAGVYSIGGATGLSLLTALLAGVAWYLITATSVPGVSTWWGSIVAALALIVCYPQFTARPELITLIGIALVFWMLHRWKNSQSPWSLWGLVAVFAVWSNLDPRMFLGLAALTLYAAGESIGTLIGRSGLAGEAQRKHLWIIVACCFVASMANPFLWESLATVPSLYGVEYPALRDYHPIGLTATDQPSIQRLQYYPMLEGLYWKWTTHHAASGVVVLVTALMACVLNRAKLDFGHLFVLGGFLGLAIAGSHELAAAAIAACVIATLNIQQWYRANFRQSYSVEMSELIFSRGGRAVTVIALFVVAFLGVTGRMTGSEGARIGVGFSDSLRATFEGLRSSLDDSFDDQPFNFRLSQGDHLIWIGKKPFVDSRVAIFHGDGEDNILHMHDTLRHALLRKRDEDDWTGRPDIWKPAFDRYGVTHVVPRLSGKSPDYNTYFDMLRSGHWHLAELGPITAVLYRRNTSDPALNDYLRKHELNFLTAAFGEESKPPSSRLEWAKAKTAYDKFFHAETRVVSNPVQLARHYMRHIALFRDRRTQAAITYLIIRKMNEGLADGQFTADAFQILGEAYSFLRNLEAQLCAQSGFKFVNETRFLQSLIAFRQSLLLEPDNAAIHEMLVESYLSVNKFDLALQSLHRIEELTEDESDLTEQQLARKRRYEQLETQLSNQAEQFAIAVDQELEEETNVMQTALLAHNRGYVLLALRLLDENQVAVAENSAGQLLHGILLMQVGRLEEASTIFSRLESMDPRYTAGVKWQDAAATLAMANADYVKAVMLHTESIRRRETAQVGNMLNALPMNQTPAIFFKPGEENWPIERSLLWPGPQWVETSGILFGSASQMVSHQFHIAISNLEAGRIEEATEAFQAMLDTNPETLLRPLVRFYLYEVTGDLIDIEPPSDWIPNTLDMFASDDSGSQ